MIHITIFSGHEGKIRPESKFYLTIFGGTTLVRPTLVRRILAARAQDRNGSQEQKKGPFFFTLFGALEIVYPTLAEEFIDLRDSVNGGAITLRDWDQRMLHLSRNEESLASFTLFGGASENEVPSENDELDSLALHCHMGNISENVARILQMGIKQPEAERLAAVRRAAAEAF